MQIQNRCRTYNINWKSLSPILASVIACAGALVYAYYAWSFAHSQMTILDEGAYLYKGFLFASGKYFPFQEYGPWGNHMPLSFLIPGHIQKWFGVGLHTGRYFSIVLGLMLLLGSWVVAYRLGDNWWAAGAVWSIVINPFYIKVYSLAFSQVLVACMLVWIMVCVVDKRAPIWRIGLGGALAGMMLLTRMNMIVVIPIMIIYIFWQHGKRAGITAIITSSLVIIAGHLYFWPGIMRLWASWIPETLTPFLNSWRSSNQGIARWNPEITPELRWLSFWSAIRNNFIAMFAVFGLGVLVINRRIWKNEYYWHTAVLLVALVIPLIAGHAWASLGKNYCVFCFTGYLTFFTPLTWPLVTITFKGSATRSRIYAVYISGLLIILAAGIGFASYKDIGVSVLDFPFPRISEGRLVGGAATLWALLKNKWNLDYNTARVAAPFFAGMLLGTVFVILSVIIYRKVALKYTSKIGFGYFTAALTLSIGFMLSPTKLLSGSYQEYDCSGDIIKAQEAAGDHLASNIAPGSQVYWQGSLSVAPLLYAPEITIYPPQINDGYAFRIGGETLEIARWGLWNEELAEQWKNEADYIVVEDRYYNIEWKAFLESGRYAELEPSPSTAPCRDNARLRIFRKSN